MKRYVESLTTNRFIIFIDKLNQEFQYLLESNMFFEESNR